jgi:hypothetical protein
MHGKDKHVAHAQHHVISDTPSQKQIVYQISSFFWVTASVVRVNVNGCVKL